MSGVRLVNLTKRFGSLEVVSSVNLDIADGEFIVIVGASGSGKSTTLRMIAGLEATTSGEIWIGDHIVNDIPPKGRDIAMVFQDYALYPHMSVYENLEFALRYSVRNRAEIKQRVAIAAEILGIESLLQRKPKELSGGQKQRVAMGRAIVREPRVFLFDEPLSNLDAKLRVQMRTEIKRLHHRLATTFIHVTHDQVEAMTLADRIVVMHNGAIEQVGTPNTIYGTPATTYVAGFIGSPPMNLIPAVLDSTDSPCLRFSDGRSLALSNEKAVAHRGLGQHKVVLGIRPEHFSLSISVNGSVERAELAVRVDVTEPLGSDTLLFFSLGDAEAIARVRPEPVVRQGETVVLELNLEHLVLFDAETGQALATRR